MDKQYWLNWLNAKYDSGPARRPQDQTVNTYAYNLAWLAARMDGFADGRVPTPEDVVTYMDTNDVKNGRRGQSYTAMKVYHNCCGERNCSHRYRRNDMSMAKKEEFARRCLHSAAVNDIYRKLD